MWKQRVIFRDCPETTHSQIFTPVNLLTPHNNRTLVVVINIFKCIFLLFIIYIPFFNITMVTFFAVGSIKVYSILSLKEPQ